MTRLSIDIPSGELAAVLRRAQESDLVLETGDGKEFLVSAIDDFDKEVAAHRRSEKLMALLDERSKEKGGVPLEQVMKELGLS